MTSSRRAFLEALDEFDARRMTNWDTAARRRALHQLVPEILQPMILCCRLNDEDQLTQQGPASLCLLPCSDDVVHTLRFAAIEKSMKSDSAAIFENGRFRRPFWNFEILNILINININQYQYQYQYQYKQYQYKQYQFRMPKNIWIDTKIMQIGHFYIFTVSPTGGGGHLGFWGFWRKCSRVPVWHSSDLDSAPQNLLETAPKILDIKKRGSDKKTGLSLGLKIATWLTINYRIFSALKLSVPANTWRRYGQKFGGTFLWFTVCMTAWLLGSNISVLSSSA